MRISTDTTTNADNAAAGNATEVFLVIRLKTNNISASAPNAIKVSTSVSTTTTTVKSPSHATGKTDCPLLRKPIFTELFIPQDDFIIEAASSRKRAADTRPKSARYGRSCHGKNGKKFEALKMEKEISLSVIVIIIIIVGIITIAKIDTRLKKSMRGKK